jgi:acyl dehydratase
MSTPSDTQTALQPEHARSAKRLAYFEDIVSAPTRTFGPIVFSTALLDQLLDLMGEKHPVHDSDDFAKSTTHKQRIVPGGFIHSITSGWAVQHGMPGAVIGLKTVTWDFVRPLYPDTPFYFTTEVEYSEELSERAGLLKTTRRVFYESKETIAIGRMTVIMAKRGPPNA